MTHIYHIEYQGSLLRRDHLLNINTKHVEALIQQIKGGKRHQVSIFKIASFWELEPRILLLKCPLDLDTLDTLDSPCVHVSRMCARCGGVRSSGQAPRGPRIVRIGCYRFSRALAPAPSTSPHTLHITHCIHSTFCHFVNILFEDIMVWTDATRCALVTAKCIIV